MLHYFALDSAKHWDELLTNVLPAVRLPGASARRATALELFGASHIQPSHRRMPHVLWTDSMTLIWNLLMGGRMGRYTGSPDTLVLDQRVDLRVSAGSFAGLSTLQLLWKIPNVVTKGKLGAIACPPQLLVTPPTSHALHLLHYERINYVCGSLAIASWTSSKFAIRMLALRARPIKSTLEQGSTAIHIGFRLISRQVGGTLPGFFSCTPLLRAPQRGMPRPFVYSRGSVFVWNRLWRRSLRKPCFISPRQRR